MTVKKSPNKIFQFTIGEVIREWRKTRQMTLTELAKAAEVTKDYLSQLENDKIKHPSDDHLIRIANALNIPVLSLVNRHLPK